MARLIPAFMDERTPPGEREVFNMLAAGPDDWVALHSLDLAPWNRSLRTEIDFVIIVPDTGILCVEVKSHEFISFDGEKWEPATIKRSPFKQAADARHAFHRRLTEFAPSLRRIPVVHCCIFPNARFELRANMSVSVWELMDNRGFRQFRTGRDFCADLKTRMEKSMRADNNLRALHERIRVEEVETVVRVCLPVSLHRPGAREEINKRGELMDRLMREQQKPVLQLAHDNDRLIVSGGAGTGKTFIALEIARRAAERGDRVGLLCFNRLIGDWMERQLKHLPTDLPNLIVGRAVQVMAAMAEVSIPAFADGQFWSVELPERIEERLTEPDFNAIARFDYLVLDEAQDLLARPRLWECLTQFIVGGIETGRFVLLGDFENQVLADRLTMNETVHAVSSIARPAKVHLRENCRNYPIIGETAVRLSGFGSDVYDGYMRSGGGIDNYHIEFYETGEEQVGRLRQLLNAYQGKGYRASEIAVLSFVSDEHGAAERLNRTGYQLRPAWKDGRSTLYSTVHGFKGMESKIVILTDVVLTGAHFQRDLFYTGMTRATEGVSILCHSHSKETLVKWLSGTN